MGKHGILLATATFGALTCLACVLPANAATERDKAFVIKAAQAGMAEVQAAQLAIQYGVDANVRDFAQRMINDHSRANRELKQIATSEGFALPAGPDASHRAELQRLSRLSGDAFDRNYTQDQIRDHRAAVNLFQSEINRGANPQLRQFAESTLPTLQMHRSMTYEVAASLPARPSLLAHRTMRHHRRHRHH